VLVVNPVFLIVEYCFVILYFRCSRLYVCYKPLLWSESLSGKCAKLRTVAASNYRDHEITVITTISKCYQMFTSFTNII